MEWIRIHDALVHSIARIGSKSQFLSIDNGILIGSCDCILLHIKIYLRGWRNILKEPFVENSIDLVAI